MTNKIFETFTSKKDEIKKGIKYNCECGKYCAMFELEIDKEKLIPSIMEKYKESGYQVILIKNGTNIDGHSVSKLNTMFLIIIWNGIQVLEKIGNNVDIIEEGVGQ